MSNDLSKWGIYIHVPWCRRRCSYCDFYFEIGKSDKNFADALYLEWQERASQYLQKPAHTLYFGGGTPSTLPVEQIAKIIAFIKAGNSLILDAEITLEANPEDLTKDYLGSLKQAGVNRLSLGIQSFDDNILKWLGRKHRRSQAEQCIELAQQVGFENLSVDLIVGVPGEQWKCIEESIGWLKTKNIAHVSVYVLTIEEKTPLSRMIEQKKRVQPDEDAQAEVYERVQASLVQHGYRQYEISSYAKPGYESQHNRLYWSKGCYLGLGPGAHSMSLQADGSVLRKHTEAQLAEWLLNPAKSRSSEELLNPRHGFLESVAFGIRDVLKGVDVVEQLQRHKVVIPVQFWSVIDDLVESGWVVRDEDSLYLTATGTRFADAVGREILGI